MHFLDAGYFYEAECMYEAVTGEAFLPEALPLADIRGLTQQHGNEALYAADNDYTTIWHSAWEPAAPRQDHVLILELRERSLVEGIRYLPRQDKATNGIITEYEIQISNDGGKSYTKAAEGTWNADASWKQAQFEKPAAATHLKILAKAGAGGHSSAAEIRVDGLQKPENACRQITKHTNGTIRMKHYMKRLRGNCFEKICRQYKREWSRRIFLLRKRRYCPKICGKPFYPC